MHALGEKRRKRGRKKWLKRSETKKRGRAISRNGQVVCGGSKKCVYHLFFVPH